MSVPGPARQDTCSPHHHHHYLVLHELRNLLQNFRKFFAHSLAARPSAEMVEACGCCDAGGPGPSTTQRARPHTTAAPVHGELAERRLRKVEVERKKKKGDEGRRGGPTAHVHRRCTPGSLQTSPPSPDNRPPPRAGSISRPRHCDTPSHHIASLSLPRWPRPFLAASPSILMMVTFAPTRPTFLCCSCWRWLRSRNASRPSTPNSRSFPINAMPYDHHPL
ncbi:hypothetical protein BKA80DRAFT_282236 [Phyllosticta citrichinensis]